MRRFQFTLRTSVVLTFIAGAFVGANVIPYGTDVPLAIVREYNADGTPKTAQVFFYKQRGWPAAYVDYIDNDEQRRYYRNHWAIAWNVICLMFMLGGVWVMLERPGRKKTSDSGSS